MLGARGGTLLQPRLCSELSELARHAVLVLLFHFHHCWIQLEVPLWVSVGSPGWVLWCRHQAWASPTPPCRAVRAAWDRAASAGAHGGCWVAADGEVLVPRSKATLLRACLLPCSWCIALGRCSALALGDALLGECILEALVPGDPQTWLLCGVLTSAAQSHQALQVWLWWGFPCMRWVSAYFPSSFSNLDSGEQRLRVLR